MLDLLHCAMSKSGSPQLKQSPLAHTGNKTRASWPLSFLQYITWKPKTCPAKMSWFIPRWFSHFVCFALPVWFILGASLFTCLVALLVCYLWFSSTLYILISGWSISIPPGVRLECEWEAGLCNEWQVFIVRLFVVGTGLFIFPWKRIWFLSTLGSGHVTNRRWSLDIDLIRKINTVNICTF